MITIIKGNIISSSDLNKLDIFPNSFLVAKDGIIEGIFETLPIEYKNKKIDDYGDNLVMQSFSDMHLHAPQYVMNGMGLDLPLMEWLNTYTFPTEAHFKDTSLARKVYKKLARDLIENGTTRVCIFSSIHVDSTLILMEELEKAGVQGYVGKVNMDRNGGVDLIETTEESKEETLRWLEASKRFTLVKPMLTPRFTPSCTKELMNWLGEQVKTYNLPVQSHLSENTGEIQLVKSLHPECDEYWETYNNAGLWTNKTLMAHCVHSSKKEIKAMKDAGIYVVHCANSNVNILSGIAPIKEYINQGINVVLGSDIAGGDQLSMFENIVSTIKTSKQNHIVKNKEIDFISVDEAFYLATSAANKFFDEQPGFAKGNALNAIVINDDEFISPIKLDLHQRFERCIHTRQKNGIRAVYSLGKQVL